MSPIPGTHGEHAPGLVCGRIVGPGIACGEPADWHVIFDLDTADNSICCAEHLPLMLADDPPAWHPYDPLCSVAGAEFLHYENRCIVPDLLGSTEA